MRIKRGIAHVANRKMPRLRSNQIKYFSLGQYVLYLHSFARSGWC